jgi:hypothetical protein
MNPDVENGRTLKRYLLGQLDEQEQQRLEREIMTDNHTFEQISAAEDELVEEYLEGSLSAREREKFENHFLSTPERRQELKLAKALRKYVPSQKSASKVSFWESLLALLGAQPAFLKHALSAVLVLAVVGGVWSGRQAWRYSQEIAQIRSQQTTSQDQMQNLQRQLGEQRSRSAQLAEELERQEEQRSQMDRAPKAIQQPSLVALALSPGLVRSTGSVKRLVVPPSASLIKLELDLLATDYPTYRVILQDADGQEIITLNRLKAGRSSGRDVVVVTLPASLVPRGDYSLKLSGRSAAGDFEDLGRYYFRVVKQ